ncbi:hypothetical protein Ndes2526B_g01069 [Nannochloris sp. 'desiccata']
MQAEPSDAPILTTAPIKPSETPDGIEDSAALLQSFASIPSLAKAWAFPSTDGVRISIQHSQRNLPANAQRKFLTHFSLNEAVLEHGEADTSLPLDLRDALMVSPSPSGKHMLIVRPASAGNGNKDTSAILEIWDRSRVLQEIHVPCSLHGSMYNDGWFGSGAAWSPDETRLAYVAEMPVLSKAPEFGGAQKGPDGKKMEGAGPKGWRGIGEFQEDWGELNTGKRAPALFVLELSSGQVAEVQGMPENASVGQPQWSPDGQALVFVAWKHAASNFPDFPQRLGIVFCFNRPCALHAVAWPQPPERGSAPPAIRLTPPSLQSSFSPRFSPDGKVLVMLSQVAAVESGAHAATPTLLALPWEDVAPVIAIATSSSIFTSLPQPRRIVDIVWRPSDVESFPGLYCNVLPEQPFVGSSKTLVSTVQWRSNFAVVAIDVETGDVTRITPNNGSSWSLLAVQQDWMLVTESHPGQPFKLFACHVAESQRSQPHTWSWSRLVLPDTENLPDKISHIMGQIETRTLQINPTTGEQFPFEAVMIRRKDLGNNLPTVLTPHGGPHTAYPAQYFMPLSFLVASGYCVILVNYRGSTGFGESALQSLPGSIGTNDVADCMAALTAAIGHGWADSTKVAAVGGSHGGFLSSHLVGQHPDAFCAAVLRNPVCNISLMVHLSDIPDWCFIECYGSEKGREKAGSGPAAEDIEKMYQMSPISHVDKVKAPVLMMLGAVDRRVPYDDGKRYLERLKRRADGPETRLTVFPQDAHGLDKPQTEFEQWVTALWWLDKHVK